MPSSAAWHSVVQHAYAYVLSAQAAALPGKGQAPPHGGAAARAVPVPSNPHLPDLCVPSHGWCVLHAMHCPTAGACLPGMMAQAWVLLPKRSFLSACSQPPLSVWRTQLRRGSAQVCDRCAGQAGAVHRMPRLSELGSCL